MKITAGGAQGKLCSISLKQQISTEIELKLKISDTEGHILRRFIVLHK